MKLGTLYLVPTPIGNLEDITLRALHVLRTCAFIGAEDTRQSAILLRKYEITTPLHSYHKFNERKRTEQWLERLKQGDDIAIITDAGTPGISDPCAVLVKEAIEQGIEVNCLPGATAFVPALVASGLPTERFHFFGFLPEKRKERKKMIAEMKALSGSLLLYESPHHLQDTLIELLEELGDRQIVLARELTKIHETYHRGSLKFFVDNPTELVFKGEFVMVLEGITPGVDMDIDWDALVSPMQKSGMKASEIVKQLVETTGQPRNIVYQKVLECKQ